MCPAMATLHMDIMIQDRTMNLWGSAARGLGRGFLAKWMPAFFILSLKEALCQSLIISASNQWCHQLCKEEATTEAAQLNSFQHRNTNRNFTKENFK